MLMKIVDLFKMPAKMKELEEKYAEKKSKRVQTTY